MFNFLKTLFQNSQEQMEQDLKPKEVPECKLPPVGWKCSRPEGHEGPCAATEVEMYITGPFGIRGARIYPYGDHRNERKY